MLNDVTKNLARKPRNAIEISQTTTKRATRNSNERRRRSLKAKNAITIVVILSKCLHPNAFMALSVKCWLAREWCRVRIPPHSLWWSQIWVIFVWKFMTDNFHNVWANIFFTQIRPHTFLSMTNNQLLIQPGPHLFQPMEFQFQMQSTPQSIQSHLTPQTVTVQHFRLTYLVHQSAIWYPNYHP